MIATTKNGLRIPTRIVNAGARAFFDAHYAVMDTLPNGDRPTTFAKADDITQYSCEYTSWQSIEAVGDIIVEDGGASAHSVEAAAAVQYRSRPSAGGNVRYCWDSSEAQPESPGRMFTSAVATEADKEIMRARVRPIIEAVAPLIVELTKDAP